MTTGVDEVRPLLATGPPPRKAGSVAFHSGQGGKVKRSRRRALGLRARLTIGFALAALLGSLSLTLVTYLLARNYLLDQRQSGAVTQALVNARLVRDILRDRESDPGRFIRSVQTERDGFAVLNYRGTWFPSTPGSTRRLSRRRFATPRCRGRRARSGSLSGARPTWPSA